MLKFRINRKRGQRDPEPVPVDDVPLPEPVAEESQALVKAGADSIGVNQRESHIGTNKAGRAYDKRTGRLIKPADLASHEV